MADKAGLDGHSSAHDGQYGLLTPREKQVLSRFADGLLYKEIADELGISYSAVHKYQQKIFAKLHVTNRTEAVRNLYGPRRA